jgi:DNA-directed RNA polymerase specialized sigma24 family protein
MRKIEEVLRLHDAGGRSNREIAQTVQVSPTTPWPTTCGGRDRPA